MTTYRSYQVSRCIQTAEETITEMAAGKSANLQLIDVLGLGHICHGGRGVSKIYGHSQLYGGRSISTVTQCSSHICFYFWGAARGIYKLWRPKTWGCRTVFDLMSHGDLRAFLQQPYNFQGRRKVASRCPQGDCRRALRRTCGQTDGNEWVYIPVLFLLK